MTEDKNCDGCANTDRCSAVYEKIGHTKGPPVVYKVILAFLLPIIIFIVSLALCEQWLKGVFENKNFPTAIAAIVAFITVLIYIFAVRFFSNRQASIKYGSMNNAGSFKCAKGEIESKP